ncbi:hypothetical protein HMPREF0388_0419 [Mobiluncus curtisii ATCC 51333]|uniref:Uncharacterized protein n=1 Tax=Mobiluncus curtisii ATCC 51333 TaxID=887326 RepID=E6LXE6_9ACTO|nr:hypothetical protein HMPREF0388_0419 [Mobiluncus curtisii ATCC 51333]
MTMRRASHGDTPTQRGENGGAGGRTTGQAGEPWSGGRLNWLHG